MNYEVTQRLMALATTYDVREAGADAVVYEVHGAFTSPKPKFSLTDVKDKKEIASLAGNFNKTRFHVADADGKELASVEFPSIAIKKKLVLLLGDKTYSADAGILSRMYDFKCADAAGDVAVQIKKGEGPTKVRDHFVVEPGPNTPMEVAILLAIAIHSRYFEMI